jgi:phosphatidylglycerol:prolipoprotein diacylglycerol transferase
VSVVGAVSPTVTHDAFSAAGVVVAALVWLRAARSAGRLDTRLFVVGAGCLAGAAVGARAAFVWRYATSAPEPTLLGFLVQGGKSVVGGLAGAYVGALVAKRSVGLRERTGDLFAPAVALGIAVGRIGCSLTEPPGTPTSLPWGVTLSAERIAATPGCTWCVPGVAYHPSFLVALAGCLVWLRSRLAAPADVFPIFLLAYAVFRFGVEFVRGNPEMAFGLSGTQLFVAPAAVVLVVGSVRRRPRWDAPLTRRRWSHGGAAPSGSWTG